MRALIASLALALAACGQTSAPPEPAAESATAPVVAEPVGEPMSAGLMGGYSTSASGDVAAMTPSADQLAFINADGEETFAVSTQFLGVVAPTTLIAAGGESFAAAAPSANASRVELRRITSTAPERLCGGMTATYVAIVSSEPLTALQLMVFTGADAPGPEARDSAICAINAYAVD